MKLRRQAVATAIAALAALARAAEEPEPGLTLTLGAHEIYDENLYRLPDDVSRSDYLSRLTFGIEQQWQWSRQKVLIDLNASHNAYRHNDYLDNTSVDARAAWQWEAGRLVGTFAGDYNQALASFANTRFQGRDVLDTVGGTWKLGLKLGPQWSLHASGRHAETEHSAEVRNFDDSSTDSASIGLQFTTSSENEFALSYRATRAEFQHAATLNGLPFDRNYEERGGNLRLHYAWSEKTAFDGNFGYLEREYPNPSSTDIGRGSFSGGVWDATIEWQPTIKIGLEIAGWRKLRAYLDAESDYFVSEGASVVSSWHPSDRIGLAFEAGYETQDFLGSSANLVVADGRRDRVWSRKLTLSYRALRKLHLDLSGRVEDRQSNREGLQYDARVASLGVRWEY
jgi:hypothetical protein